MEPPLFFAGAVVLLILGAFLIGKTSPLARLGGDAYERKKKRRMAGQIMICAAVLCVVLGLSKQLVPSQIAPPASPATNSAVPWPKIAPTPLVVTASAQLPAEATEIHTNAIINATPSPTTERVAMLLRETVRLFRENKYDAALVQVNMAIVADPKNAGAYALRGTIDAAKNRLDLAEKDYESVLQIDGENAQMKFNLAQIEFAEKKYDAARPRFAALQEDPEMGDFANYKVFLCDLLGGHEVAAGKEFDAFNQVGSNASFYFANAAWSLRHRKMEDARGWLDAAGYIYAPAKFKLYADGLTGLAKAADSSEDTVAPAGRSPPAAH